jgi:hypothetical protein
MRRSVLVVLALVAVATWRTCGGSSKKTTGILIFSEPSPDSVHWRDAWLDLASGETGLVTHNFGSTVSYVSKRTELWIGWSGQRRHDHSGVLHIARAGRGIAERLVPNTTVVSVSPSGKVAVMYGKTPGPWEMHLVLGRVTANGFEQKETFGIERIGTHVYGWFDDRTILASEDERLLRVTVGMRPVVVGRADDYGEGSASHAMKLFAWSTDIDENQQQELHIVSLTDPSAAERVIPLGRGEGGKCEFAPGDRTIACMIGEPYTGDLRQYVVDVASGTVRNLTAFGTGLTFSPDGTSLALFGAEITIVPLDGSAPRKLGRPGAPMAWIR